MGHIPQRTCVACRKVRPKEELLRIVRTPAGEIKADLSGKLSGRGAYVCPTKTCLTSALKQGKLERALGKAPGEDLMLQLSPPENLSR
jgi:predicted RNA-binding protein YlxR (DUF448 family)